MAANRGVHRPTSVPKPGMTHAQGAKGGIITGSTGTTPPMTGTGGIKTDAHGCKGGLVQPGGYKSGGKRGSSKD